MFILAAVGVFSFAYWFSALVGEIVCTSPEERRIAAPLRAFLGLLLATAYFAAAWQLVSIAQAWIIGIALLGPYAWANRKSLAFAGALRSHAHGYAACLAAVMLFFGPIIASRDTGPFTEGGGDISLYADVAKLLTDGDMTAFGQPSPDFRNVAPNLRSLLDFRGGDRYVKFAAAREAFIARNGDKLNPPIADAQAYRAVADIFFTSVYYAPYAQFDFLAGDTNYAVYYGVQAFFYAVLLLSVWHFFAPMGRRYAIAATAMAAASHSLISVYYNGYSMQGLSMAVCALTLCLATIVRPVSVAGLRTYGIGLALVWLCYTHFLSLLVPLLLIGLWMQLASRRMETARGTAVVASASERVILIACAVMFVVLVAVMLASGSAKALEFVGGLVDTLIGGARSQYLGDRLAAFSQSWLAFLFGFVSQQHLPPFKPIRPQVVHLIGVGIAAGISLLALGAALAMRSWTRATRDLVVIYGVLLLTTAVHVLLAQSSLYTQAKGAQDSLTLLYCALVLPLFIGDSAIPAAGRWRIARDLLLAALVVFVGVLAIVRLVIGAHLAFSLDRATILETSYFSEAKRVRREDPQAFVLFEPRKSGDLYVSAQAFAGAKMVPTRHLALQRVALRPSVTVSRINASELIAPGDISHLWTLSARRLDAGGPPWKKATFQWEAERLTARTQPALLLFADDYARDAVALPRSADSRDIGMFSSVTNGAAVLFVPAGGTHELEITLMAREPEDRASLVRELAGDFVEDGERIRLRRSIAGSATPQLVTIARFGGKYLLNVRLDGKDVVTVRQEALGG